jgi:hypothetical protein
LYERKKGDHFHIYPNDDGASQTASNSLRASSMNLVSTGLIPPPAKCPQIDGIGRKVALGMRLAFSSWDESSVYKGYEYSWNRGWNSAILTPLNAMIRTRYQVNDWQTAVGTPTGTVRSFFRRSSSQSLTEKNMSS